MRQRKRQQQPEAVDQFRRTSLRHYTKPPREDNRVSRENQIHKRYFDMPEMSVGMRVVYLAACMLLVIVFCNGSAPLADVPSVQERFSDWAAVQNEKMVKPLPGATPEPGTELYETIQMDREQQEQQEEILNATPAPEATDSPQSKFKHYEPGELVYETDRLKVSIEQKQKDGMTYFVADVQLSNVSQFKTAFAGDDFRSGIYEAVSDIAGRYSPVLAINADFCRYHREGVIIRNGELLRAQNIKKHHLLIVDKDGNLSAETNRSGKQGLVANRLEQAETWQTFEFGPVLVENGEPVELPKSFYINCNEGYDNPRTAIGQKGPLHYVIIVVDGRRDGYSTGASIPQVQQLFLDEGVDFAFNLDGGGSTTLYFLGEVVNMPSGGKERSVSDIIMFMPNPG